MAESVTVKHMKCVMAREGVLVIDRISSGVGLILFNPAQRTAVGVHILAPKSHRLAPPNPARFADTAVPHALYQFEKNGFAPPTSIALAGGAEPPDINPEFNVGKRIVKAVKAALEKAKLKVKLEETGGHKIRMMLLNIDAGKIKIG